MDWLRRAGRHSPPSGAEPVAGGSEAVETAAPGIAALLTGVPEDGSRSVLDLGPGSAARLALYGRFAGHVRFADLLGHATARRGRGSEAEIRAALPAQPDRPYDIVFFWDVLDRLSPELHKPLVERLVEVTAPGARLHVVLRASDQGPARALRFTLLGTDRMKYEPTGSIQPVVQRLLPAQVAHLLEPFRVAHGYTLKGGLREYVAFRPDA